MPNKVKWTTEWPTEEGRYWFYGWYWRWQIDAGWPPCLSYVGVYTYDHTSGIRYVAEGLMMEKKDGGYGLWTKVEFPELPEIERPEIKESE